MSQKLKNNLQKSYKTQSKYNLNSEFQIYLYVYKNMILKLIHIFIKLCFRQSFSILLGR
jgi:hypothetical protein